MSWRRVGAAIFSGAGTFFVFGLVLVMNSAGGPSSTSDERAAASFDVAPVQSKPPPKKKPAPKKQRRRSRTPPPPAPIVGAELGGLAFGLDALASGLGSDADSLLGDIGDVVMTRESVDEGPEPVERAAPKYPDRARKKGITGRVEVGLLVSAAGVVQDAKVLSASPVGVFEEAALEAARRWRFRPAMYEGQPVAIRVTLPLSFGFEG